MFVVAHEAVLPDHLLDRFRAALDRGVTVVVGAISEDLREEIHAELADATVFVSGLAWLSGQGEGTDDTEISRLSLVDRQTILVSSLSPDGSNGLSHEQAVFGR